MPATQVLHFAIITIHWVDMYGIRMRKFRTTSRFIRRSNALSIVCWPWVVWRRSMVLLYTICIAIYLEVHLTGQRQ